MKKNKIIKILLQIVFFIWIPESFSITLFALKTLVSSVVQLRFEYILDPVIILLGTIVSTVLFGRYYCGYICAFGAMQDLSFDVRKLLSGNEKKHVVPAKADVIFSKIKYIILAVILILAVPGIGIPQELSPWTSFGNLISFVSGSVGFHHILTVGLGVLLAIVLITAFYFRAFCRYLCPVGALYSLVSVFSHDRRSRTCGNSGDCCICPYKCSKYRIHYPGLVIAVLIFVGTNLFLVNVSDRLAEKTAEGTAVKTAKETTEKATEKTAEKSAEERTEETTAAAAESIEELMEAGPFPDGTYEGVGTGYRGEIAVSVVVENGYIVSVEVTEHKEDESYFRSVEHRLIEEILKTQSADVDAVSGATYSSNGLTEAVKRALGLYEASGDEPPADSESAAKEEPEEAAEGTEKEPEETAEVTEKEPEEAAKETGSLALDLSHLEDGVYEGSGIGFRGEIKAAVTVRDHTVESIRILSYYDNEEYLFHISQPVINEVLSREPLDVDAVSGATYSSNGLTRAIADALQIDENTFVILEEKPRQMKDKESHHVPQKYIESDEQYQELVEKYKELMYGADGKRKE